MKRGKLAVFLVISVILLVQFSKADSQNPCINLKGNNICVTGTCKSDTGNYCGTEGKSFVEQKCYCHTECNEFGDCCADYFEVCPQKTINPDDSVQPNQEPLQCGEVAGDANCFCPSGYEKVKLGLNYECEPQEEPQTEEGYVKTIQRLNKEIVAISESSCFFSRCVDDRIAKAKEKLEQRAELMQSLAEINPEWTLQLALPSDITASLQNLRGIEGTQIVSGNVEKEVSASGFIGVQHIDISDFKPAFYNSILTSRNGENQVIYGEFEPTDSEVAVQGIQLAGGGIVASSASPIQGSAPPSFVTSSVEKVAVIIMDYPSEKNTMNSESVKAVMDVIKSYYSTSAYGKFSVDYKSFGPVLGGVVPCGQLVDHSDLIGQAGAQGYDAYVFMLPISGCSIGQFNAAGWAYVGGDPRFRGKQWIGSKNSVELVTSIVAHEFGHSLYLDAAGQSYIGHNGGPVNSNPNAEYGWCSDVMGFAGCPLNRFNAVHTDKSGWFGEGIKTVSGDSRGTYELKCLEAGSGNIGIRYQQYPVISYYVERRCGSAPPPTNVPGATQGILVSYGHTGGSSIDASFMKQLSAGESWQSSDGQFKVTVKDGDNIEVITGNGANLKPQCSDTIDNDQDTKIDYPADPGCTSVNDESEADTPPPSDEFKLTPSEVVMKVGEEKQVAMSGGKKPYSLTSLPDQSVVSIDFKEDAPIKIKGLKIGKTFFTAQDSNLKPKTVNITVSETGQDSLKVDKTSLTLKVGEQSQIKISGGKSPYTLIPPVATVGTEKIKVEFANDNSLVKVTGLKTGSASFGVKDSGSGQLTVEVNVIEDASSISSNPKDIVVVKDAQNSSLISGGTLPYVIDLVPLASIATASVSGNQLRVNGIGEGLAETKVRDSSSPKKTVTVPIEVRGKPNGLKADPSKISMGVGEQKQVQISGGLKAYSLSRTPSTSVASITDFGATTGLVKIKGEGVGGTSFGVRDSNAEIVIVQIDVSQNPPKKACSDGTDNDGDGKIDYPNDPGCTSGDDDSETDPNTLYQCSDGIDNDNDAKIDMADPGCTSSTDDSETDTPQNPACSDGKDNDGDGKIDYPNDPGCSSTNDNTEEDSQAKGGLHVVTIPDLAKVFVDGVRYRSPDSDPDKTPITVPNLDAGTHTLEIHKYGFYDYRESVTITGGQTNEKTITLESSTGNLRVISNPDSARVFVDGTRYKEPDGAGKTPLTVTGLEEGVHNIVISKDGYSSYASEVTIIAHQTKEMNAELTEALCGDGEINQPWEECDDGNTLSGDGCSFDCTIEEDTECPWYKPWKKCDPIIS